MNMKRIFSLALMALLLCLPVWAMAENRIIYLEDVIPNENKSYSIEVNENVILTQRNSQLLQRDFSLNVNGNVSVTLQDINISECFQIFGDGNITLHIEGTNTIVAKGFGLSALYTEIPTIIKGNGILNCTSTRNNGISARKGLTIQSGNIYATGINGLQAYSNSNIIVSGGSVVAIGSDYAVAGAWNETTKKFGVGSINITNSGLSLKAGADAASAVFVEEYHGEKYLKISGEQPPETIPTLPQTGDNSNVILWSALACISVIGMTMLVRKRKEA